MAFVLVCKTVAAAKANVRRLLPEGRRGGDARPRRQLEETFWPVGGCLNAAVRLDEQPRSNRPVNFLLLSDSFPRQESAVVALSLRPITSH